MADILYSSIIDWILCATPRTYPILTDSKVVYRRYASLFFVCGISQGDNELITLEIIHRYVEVLDRYFGNVSSPTSVSYASISHFERCKGL